MTTKLEKSQKELANQFSNQTVLKNQIQVDNKQLQNLFAKSHECLMAELGKVRAEIEVIRSTPVEIVATHQAPPPRETPLHSGTRSNTPQMMAPHNVINHGMHGAPIMTSQSPTRDVMMLQQTTPPFDRNSNRASLVMQGNHASYWGVHDQRRDVLTDDDQGICIKFMCVCVCVCCVSSHFE